MAYRPLLGMGKNYELMHWEVGLTMLITTLGLVAFAAAIERYLFRKATWFETLLLWCAAVGLLWPLYWADAAGVVLFTIVIVMQKFGSPLQNAGKEGQPVME